MVEAETTDCTRITFVIVCNYNDDEIYYYNNCTTK